MAAYLGERKMWNLKQGRKQMNPTVHYLSRTLSNTVKRCQQEREAVERCDQLHPEYKFYLTRRK